jgi:hypothetical protein
MEKSNLLFTILRFEEFTNLSLKCYEVIRKNASVLITLLRIMLCCGIPELSEKSISN